jgi:acetyl-CoA carboxylase carboxyl transferase subunit alpha
MEHAIYSVISPEGAASILWHDSTKAQEAATNMKITAQDLLGMKIIDAIIAEPLGGAHRAPQAVIAATGDLIARTMTEFAGSNTDFREQRREKYLAMGRSL